MSKKVPRSMLPKIRHLLGRMTRVPRFLYKACGFTDEELDRPIIAVANSWQESGPGHVHLRGIADAVKAGVRMAGGTPVEFNVIGPCSAFGSDFRYDLPQRDAIADSIEIQIKGGLTCDGLVCICTCDKSVPGMWMGAARLNLPTIFVTGGSAQPGKVRGETICFPPDSEILFEYLTKLANDEITTEEFNEFFIELEDHWLVGCGACPLLSTAETTQILTEALGLALPYSSMALGAKKLRFAKRSGMQIMDLVKNKLKFSRIVTEKSIENAIRVLNALGGGTNGVVHLLALAYTRKLTNIDLSLFDRLSRETPYLCAVEPNGPYSTIDFESAGGVPLLMRELKDLLHLDVPTVTGQTLKDNLDNFPFKSIQINREVIASISKPFAPSGAIAVLFGNLAPRGAITRISVKRKSAFELFEGPAKCFNSAEDALFGLFDGKVNSGDALIVRYQGPRAAAMSEILAVVIAVNVVGVEDAIIISDGRFSGASYGLIYIGHVTPEAFVGGPLAIVQDNDIIKVDVKNRILNIDLPPETIEARLHSWKPPKIKKMKGVLAIWAQIAEQADKGAVLKTFL
ncbi:MAG: dihydroxy-acid dehydratase [Candidatus Helarchaeota archaeon]|nr:dihydroxy-acid dehydratase [Candidatus Helarchaeota archaeon]